MNHLNFTEARDTRGGNAAEARRGVTPRRQGRRFWSHAMLFLASVLLVNGLFGERGLMQSMRARRVFAEAARDLARLKHDNAGLRDQARRLRSDPATIESIARQDLGLMRPGEIVVTVKEIK
jgi:cell division protein FtsB